MFLNDLSHDKADQLRQAFDRAALTFIHRLKQDPVMSQRADEIKSWLKEDDAFNRYLSELWDDLRGWLKADMQSQSSHIADAGQWFGKMLITDTALHDSLNQHMEQLARNVAPDFAAFLTRHISDTVQRWDAQEMSQQTELNIGKDLQFIRVNGTLVGCLIGLVLYLLSQTLGWIALLWR